MELTAIENWDELQQTLSWLVEDAEDYQEEEHKSLPACSNDNFDCVYLSASAPRLEETG